MNTKNMVELPGGTFRMGSDRFYPEERPVREATVNGFWIDRHPVTVAAHADAEAHAAWAGKSLPTEAEWEYAARGGLDGAIFTWGDEFAPLVRAARQAGARPCCAPQSPLAADGEPCPRKVIKGGSHLCAPNCCLRYRPAARQAEAIDTTTCHIGFRCVIREAVIAGGDHFHS